MKERKRKNPRPELKRGDGKEKVAAVSEAVRLIRKHRISLADLVKCAVGDADTAFELALEDVHEGKEIFEIDWGWYWERASMVEKSKNEN